MHPLDQILPWLHEVDFAVLAHGWAPHGRDYVFHVENCLGSDPGQHCLTFTHCVRLDYETRVGPKIWHRSWTDEFTDYQRWEQAGEPAGYVWGTNWSNAYPGLTAVKESPLSREWTALLQQDMFEATLETDRFFLRLIFHGVQARKISDCTTTISQVTIPLPPGFWSSTS